jgi:type I restriction enzyme S subunit
MAGESKEVARAHLADAGVEELPDDWDVVTLGDLITEERGIAVGVMYPGDHVPDGVPLIKAGDLNGSIINPQPDFRISKDKHHEYRRTALEGGELIMTLVGNVGQCAVVPARMAGWNTARAVAVMRLADSSETHFVQQCLLSRPLQHLMDVWCNTTVQATLNLKEIRQLPLPWPPKKSRDAIAAFGKALDDKIELNRRMNATLEAMARALFQSWFVDFDPVRAKMEGREPGGMDAETAALFPDGFEESELGPIPRGWEIQDLDQIAHFLNGLALQKYPPGDEGTLPVIKIAQLRKGDSHGADRCNAELPANYIVKDGDVLFSWSGSLEVELWCGGLGALNQHLFKVTSSLFPRWFYYLWTRYHLDEFRLIAADKATTMGHIQRGHLTAAKVLVPTRQLLDAMTAILSPLVDQIIANRIQSRTLATLRDTLLPKLLSGELRVNDISLPEGTRP